jgi:serine/threonine-protein kinase
VDENNPAPIDPGMVFMQIDGHGLLRDFSAVPDDESPVTPITAEAVFRAAGLDINTFTETTPTLLPKHAADQLRAWKGPHPKIPNTALTVEIATWKGRVTQAIVEFPWYRGDDDGPVNRVRSIVQKVRGLLVMAALGAGGFFAILLARRNWKKERVDKKGALRIAIVYFFFAIVVWIGRVHPIPNDDMLSLFLSIVSDALSDAVAVWLLYLALEPAVRARWPHAIVTWNRILAGKWKDAQVGSHILIGAALGMGLWTALEIFLSKPKNQLDVGIALWPLLGARSWVAALVLNMAEALRLGLLEFFALFGLRVLLKKDWLAAIAASIMFTTVAQSDVLNSPDWQKLLVTYVVLYAILMFVLVRVGLVTAISATFFLNALNRICLGTDWKAWWAPFGFATIFLLFSMVSLALWRSIGTREFSDR